MTKRTVEYVVEQKVCHGWEFYAIRETIALARKWATYCRKQKCKARILRRETTVKERVVK